MPCSALVRVRIPAEAPEIDPAAGIEDDAFLFQEVALVALPVSFPLPYPSAPGARAHLPLGVDHPLPGEVRPFGRSMQGIADLPRMTAEPGEGGDLSIGGHPSGRDARDDGVDPVVGIAHGLTGRHLPAAHCDTDPI